MAQSFVQHTPKNCSYRFFKGLQVADENLRSAALENVLDSLGSLLPDPPAPAAAAGHEHPDENSTDVVTLQEVFPSVLRVVQEW